MPIYEYRCGQCETSFEALVRPGHDDTECPRCSSRELSREMSTFAARSTNGNGVAAASEAIERSGISNGPAGGCCGGSCGCH